ncbi:MAG: hypothetical protein RR671_02495 [Raoultibacter sp.]
MNAKAAHKILDLIFFSLVVIASITGGCTLNTSFAAASETAGTCNVILITEEADASDQAPPEAPLDASSKNAASAPHEPPQKQTMAQTGDSLRNEALTFGFVSAIAAAILFMARSASRHAVKAGASYQLLKKR